jgi:hypothetical protein
MIALIVGFIVSNVLISYLRISNKGLFSVGTLLNLGILLVFALVFDIIAVKIADNWYTKH